MKGKACMVMETHAKESNADEKMRRMEIGCGDGKRV